MKVISMSGICKGSEQSLQRLKLFSKKKAIQKQSKAHTYCQYTIMKFTTLYFCAAAVLDSNTKTLSFTITESFLLLVFTPPLIQGGFDEAPIPCALPNFLESFPRRLLWWWQYGHRI